MEIQSKGEHVSLCQFFPDSEKQVVSKILKIRSGLFSVSLRSVVLPGIRGEELKEVWQQLSVCFCQLYRAVSRKATAGASIAMV